MSEVIREQDICVGDKIEITTQTGEVIQDFVVGIERGRITHIQFRNGLVICNKFRNGDSAGYSYRLLFRKKRYKVQDVIPGRDVFDLPVGSHVRSMEYDEVIPAPNLDWVVVKSGTIGVKKVHRADYLPYRQDTLSGQYRIIYLPPWE